jgi:recombinational DNA repair protein RecR
MAYTPELSMEASCTLRRIAWALNAPMTKAIERVFEHLPKILDHEKICQGCRDKSKCSYCAFSVNNQNQRGGVIIQN